MLTSISFLSSEELINIEYVTVGRAVGSNVFVVNNNSYKPFAYSTYPKMNKNEVVDLVESAIAKLRNINELDIRQYSADRAVIKGIGENKGEEEKDHFYKVCYKQYVNNIPVGLKNGELCFFVFPDMKIWHLP